MGTKMIHYRKTKGIDIIGYIGYINDINSQQGKCNAANN